jgi:DNA topoisomerase-2
MSKKTTIEQKYRKLDEIDHVRQRPGMYVGSIAMHESLSWIYDPAAKKMARKQITYNPGLIKIFSEILDNSIDEHKRNPNKLDVIKVDIEENGLISIYDNGGIPVEFHKDVGQYVPEMIFSELRAGSNFNDEDDQSLIGTNGVGSCLTNILSTSFTIETCDGKNIFKQEFTNGMRERSEPKVKPHTKNFTRITFMPDYEYFKTKLDEDNRLKLIKRVVDSAGCNPGIKFYLNGEKLNLKGFEDYVGLYTDDYEFEQDGDWSIGVSNSVDGFDQISFVNSVETYSGGTHVDYVYLQIAQQLRAFFLKKHKVEVKPSDIKQHLRLFISASNINRPKFSSQTKENMISEVKDYKSSYKVSEKFIQKLSKSNVIKAVLDWVAAKQLMAERAALRELDKDTSKQDVNRVPKFNDATEKKDRTKCMLFITEGDSAAKAIISAKTEKNAKYIGSFALKGKPLNVNDVETKKLVENKEFKNFMIINGLRLGEEVKSAADLRFGKIIFMSDQDLDGFHIRGLLINMVHRFWPELFRLGIVFAFRTPLVRIFIEKPKKIINFYTENDFKDWVSKNDGVVKYKMKYYKGLATSTAVDFKSYLEDMDTHLIPYTIEDETDVSAIDLAFSKDKGAADKRKVWLALD